MNNEQLQKLVENISLKYFNTQFIHRASFNRRLKTTGGRYLLQTHDIEINPKLLTDYDESILIGVIKHELVHYQLHLNGKSGNHGSKEFNDLLVKVGGITFVPKSNTEKIKTYTYQCQSCNLKYERIRRIDVTRYMCSKCHGNLKLI